MNRHSLPKFARVLTVATISVLAFGGAAPDPVVPPTGGANAPIQIALLADHYAATEKNEFKYDVENFITYGLMQDPYYLSKQASMRIQSYFDETPPGADSRFGFEIGTGDGNCSVKAPPDILTKLSDAVGPGNLVSHYIVIANHPYNIGCTVGNWSFVAVDAVGTDVLQHELGHLIGKLYDEWSLPANRPYPHPGLVNNTLNCADSTTPYWLTGTAFPGARVIPECDLWGGGVFHAYDACRMGAMNHKEFCLVCKAVMDKAFTFMSTASWSSDQPQPQASHEPTTASRFRIVNASFGTSTVEQPAPAPNLPRRIMRLIVDFDPNPTPKPGQPSITLRRTIFANGVYVPNYRRVGQLLYEVTYQLTTKDKKVTENLKEVGVVPDSMFQSRAYRGDAAHGTGATRPVQMFLDIPDEDASTMGNLNRTMKIQLYRIPKDVKDEMITRATWPALRKQHNFEKVGSEITLPHP